MTNIDAQSTGASLGQRCGGARGSEGSASRGTTPPASSFRLAAVTGPMVESSRRTVSRRESMLMLAVILAGALCWLHYFLLLLTPIHRDVKRYSRSKCRVVSGRQCGRVRDTSQTRAGHELTRALLAGADWWCGGGVRVISIYTCLRVCRIPEHARMSGTGYLVPLSRE
jgi:hypothetical protein